MNDNEIDLTKQLFNLCDKMLQELYYAKVNELVFDSFDKSLFELKVKFKELNEG